MNVLTLVFSLLLILSYTFFACWDKQTTSSRLKNTLVGREKAHRKLLNQYESALYRQIRGMGDKVDKEEKEPSSLSETPENEDEDEKKTAKLNRECAQLNLWPLIQEGRDNHPLLFELALKMIKTFYAPLIQNEKRLETRFLTALLKSAKLAVQEQGEAFSLEKIDLGDEDLQRLYYKMLKGTKEWNLAQNIGYPSLLDYMKADDQPTKICIFHAHPDLTTAFFGPEVSEKLHAEIHKKEATLLTAELIERLSFESGHIAIDPEIFTLLELGKPLHPEERKTFIATDAKTAVSIKKTISIKPNKPI